jgi:D-3-phosphoglycerate dehydrogenase
VNCLVTEPEIFTDPITSLAPKKWTFTRLHKLTQAGLEQVLHRKKFDIIFARLGLQFGETVMRLQPDLRMVASPTTGLNHIDLRAAKKAGVRVISLSGEKRFLRQISSTAEHAWALVLAGARCLQESSHRVSRGYWDRSELQIQQLRGNRIGIIGFGRLGIMIARYARAFGMQVLVMDRQRKKLPSYCKPARLENICRTSMVIVLTASYRKGDKAILRKRHFSLMKTHSLFVNVSRGELIEENGLLASMQRNRPAYAGLDVLSGDSTWDPMRPIRHPCILASRVSRRLLVTPHVGGYAKKVLAQTRAFLLRKVVRLSLTNKRIRRPIKI